MIGFYDSGLGGLTIVEKFRQKHPELATLYLADTINCPLGDKADEKIVQVTRAGVEYLFQAGCGLVVLACNTATSLAIRPLQQQWLPLQSSYTNKNVLGVIKPITEELINRGVDIEPILLLATQATCRSGFYQTELELEGLSECDCLALPGLAEAIESQDQSKVELILSERLNSIDVSKYRTFVLACTHYPIARDVIKQKLQKFGAKPRFRLVDQAQLVANKLSLYLQRHPRFQLPKGNLTILLSAGEVQEYRQKVEGVFGLENCTIYTMPSTAGSSFLNTAGS